MEKGRARKLGIYPIRIPLIIKDIPESVSIQLHLCAFGIAHPLHDASIRNGLERGKVMIRDIGAG